MELDAGSTQTNGGGASHHSAKVAPASDSLSNHSSGAESDDGVVELKQRVGLWSGVSLIVGTIIGSGIFISPQGVTEAAGSVGLSLIIWLICGIVSLFGALSYAELGTSIPVSGGDYAYVKFAFGDALSFLVAWTYLLLLNPSGLAVVAMTCGQYLLTPMFDDGCGAPPEYLIKMTAATVILFVAAINCYSVDLAAKIQVIFTAAKVIALIIIIVGGIYWVAAGNPGYVSTGFEGTESDISKIIMGFYSCMWSYQGWSNLNYVTEEVSEPHKNLPRAIGIAMALVITVYLLTNMSYYAVLPVEEMIASPAVAVTWAEYVIPKVAWIIPLSVALSTFGSSNGSMFVTGRFFFAAARNGHMLRALSMIQVQSQTPFPAVVFLCVLSCLYLIPGDIGSLIDLFNFVIWMLYSLTMFEVVLLRFTHKEMERPYKVQIWIPIVTFVVAILLVLIPLVTDPQAAYLFAIGFILLGLVVYIPVVWYQKHLPGMASVTIASQLLLQVVEPITTDALAKVMDTNAIEPLEEAHDNSGFSNDEEGGDPKVSKQDEAGESSAASGKDADAREAAEGETTTL